MTTTRARGVALLGVLAACGSCRDEPVQAGPRSDVHVDGGVYNSCPSITALVIAPTRILVGATATLDSLADDPDGDELMFLWSTTSGSIADASAGRTTFTCTSPGPAEVTLTVADRHGCDDAYQVELECVAAICGNAVQEAGEECDDGDARSGDGCSATCRLE